MFKFPPPLKPRGTIGIISPGRTPVVGWLTKAESFFKKHNHQTVIHAQNYLQDGQLAGSISARVEALMDMFTDNTISAILCARGGTGAVHLLDKIDYKLIARNPKPFVGFSDVTILLHAITQKTGMVTYHGPMAWNFAQKNMDARVGVDLMNVLTAKKSVKLHYDNVDVVRAGRADGILMGGNLCRLEQLIGTAFDGQSKDTILFIEDVDEVLYKMDERLNHLRLAGKFKGIRAVIVGEMVDMRDGLNGFDQNETPYGRNLRQIFMDNLPPDIPLCFDFPCGHGRNMTTLPLGANVQVMMGAKGVDLNFTIS